MGIGRVLNAKITTLHGGINATAVMSQKDRAVEVAETIVVETDVEAAVETDAEAAVDTEAVEIAETTGVETDAEAGHEEKAKAGVAMIHVISDRTQIAHHAVNTKGVMTANQGAVIQEDLEAGARKARVEAIVAEISRGVFI